MGRGRTMLGDGLGRAVGDGKTVGQHHGLLDLWYNRVGKLVE